MRQGASPSSNLFSSETLSSEWETIWWLTFSYSQILWFLESDKVIIRKLTVNYVSTIPTMQIKKAHTPYFFWLLYKGSRTEKKWTKSLERFWHFKDRILLFGCFFFENGSRISFKFLVWKFLLKNSTSKAMSTLLLILCVYFNRPN